MRTFIATRLREKRDRDIIEALNKLEDGEISEMLRRGLRLVLSPVKQSRQEEAVPVKHSKPVVKQEDPIKKSPEKSGIWERFKS